MSRRILHLMRSFFLFLFCFVLTSFSYGSREIIHLIPVHTDIWQDNNDYLHIECSILNSSSVEQTVTVTPLDSNNAVIPSAHNTSQKQTPAASPWLSATTEVLQQNDSMTLLWESKDGARNTIPKAIKIEVDVDNGFLVGDCVVFFRTGNSPSNHKTAGYSLPILQGRPF